MVEVVLGILAKNEPIPEQQWISAVVALIVALIVGLSCVISWVVWMSTEILKSRRSRRTQRRELEATMIEGGTKGRLRVRSMPTSTLAADREVDVRP